jgi:hypothetical protein
MADYCRHPSAVLVPVTWYEQAAECIEWEQAGTQ